MKTAEQRFWKKVDKNGPTPSHIPHLGPCWIWTGYKQQQGYGIFWGTQETGMVSHRFSWELENGKIPDGLKACHHCDNKSCVRPSHLFLGTSKDNTQDLIKKGLKVTPKGESVIGHKLTIAAVKEIKSAPQIRGLIPMLARKFGVSNSSIKSVLDGRTWKEVKL